MPILNTDWITLSCRTSKASKELIIMASITEEQEKQLDNGSLTLVTRNKRTFIIDASNKPVYGTIDFSTNSDDYIRLEEMDWLNYLTFGGIAVPSDYDYKTHTCHSPINTYRYYDTVNPAILAQYKHACIGKPERVCIFKYWINDYTGTGRLLSSN